MKMPRGFTLLEVMVAMAIIAIVLTAILGSQSQSVSLATEARFSTTAAFLAQSKMAELEALGPEELTSGSGDFGEDFPGYTWNVVVETPPVDEPEDVSNYLRALDLRVSFGEDEFYQYRLRRYVFLQKR
ncbi:MAG: type II secretion system minor pseudopilin GspI [Deltaproteobacteria bacterium]|nr:type II secretion system minor pseudopilin GspI [Deltaproteobacteria bacterium]MBW1919997.1 type II secretion system minor pseudopilin GspI [Deltaproteobacteria bacterium]MBW1935224.1 type II secretion system minor pseudopilin GspI [Deltaproteobacteria bacterium]MBW1976751.1 type II secretion system minor pseudopilin GspI [Deltaproteobacteria bacterium]MBW2044135.1 type II secretion system minor pseudopilin GspI [Deltaproteobacteria bacterium]